MTHFMGTHQNRLDAKGRVSISAPLRNPMKNKDGIVARWCSARRTRIPASRAGRLKHEGGQAALDALRSLPADCREAVRKIHREVVGYFENHVHRMDYPTYQAKGWAIGSGPIESACKTVIGKRMKNGGMRRGEDGGDEMCHSRLFAMLKSVGGLLASRSELNKASTYKSATYPWETSVPFHSRMDTRRAFCDSNATLTREEVTWRERERCTTGRLRNWKFLWRVGLWC